MPSKRVSSSLKLSKKSCKALTLVISGLLVLCVLLLLNKYVFKLNENYQNTPTTPPQDEVRTPSPPAPPTPPVRPPSPPAQDEVRNVETYLRNDNNEEYELDCRYDETRMADICQVRQPNLPPPPPPPPSISN